MKINSLKFFSVFLVSSAILAGCGGLGKMEKYIDELNAKVEPEPLIVQGDSVEITISGKFPPKYFHKKVTVAATPVLTYDGGETAYETDRYQGEAAAGNGTVVPYEAGASFSFNDKIAYDKAMEVSTLELRISGTKGSKSATFAPLVIGKGVITTPYLLQNDDRPIMSTDKFQRVLSANMDAVINYAYNMSNVRPSELTDTDIKAMNAFIALCAESDSLVIKGSTVMAYASPEGEILLNENLADERAASANAVVSKQVSKNKIEVDAASFYKNVPKGEDWDGFKDLMEKADIEDAALILRVLEMYKDADKREQEIKNIAKTYKEIEDEILPQLRRSQINIAYDVEGYTDEELKVLAKSNPDILTAEELLFAATLFETLKDKMTIYGHAERMYPADYRGINNVGYCLFLQNKVDEARGQFEKAYAVNKAPEVANNLAICARRAGDRDGAMDYFSNAAGAGTDVKYNKALVQVQNGNYSGAVSNMGTAATFNVALAKLLNNDAGGAATAMSNSNDESAVAYYLRAVISARQGNGAEVLSNLNKAIELDSSLKAKAKRDLEFRDFSSQFTF